MKRASLVAAFILLSAAPAVAAPEDVANQIASEVMSPFCDGVTLHDCPSQTALDLREQIETWARAGWTKTEIVDELESRYGPRIHATPQESEGIGAWALPAATLVAGLTGAILLASRWTRRRPKRATETVDPGDHARVERELAAFREETS